ncbi:MAG: FKBP12-associated protein [Trizodia sp. TS-e1964]|nr:MAG: FKBP12-associated protein [Trizodia sp. TS-e1964]
MVTCSCQHLKQEMRCNGSKSSEGNSNKSLKCDDECARLERNRNLALALKIDPETHVDYFIPYSSETLAFFQEHPAWSQTQERLFRAFAIDSNEKRLRFKPMPHHQRAFLHCLSDDFGFDSESLDPDQHRHVAVFKTPRFVKAPSKLLADCVNLSTRSIVVAHPIAAPIAAPSPLPTRIPSGPFNSFVLTKPRFGLTLEDVHANLLPAISNCPQLIFETNFLPSEEIVIRARPYALAPKPPSTTTYETDRAIVEPHLTALKPSIEKLVLTNSLATALHLCRVDASLHILRREGAPTPDTSPSAGGWSQVAAKAAAPPCQRPVMEAFGVKSSFTVLSAGSASKAREKRKAALERKKGARAPAEEVEEDWEVAEERAEAVEKAEAGGVA